MPDTILGRAIVLVASMVLLLAAINVAIIFLRAPPIDAPLTSYEVARLLKGEPIGKASGKIATQASFRTITPQTETDKLIAAAIAWHLGVPNSSVSFRGFESFPQGLLKIKEEIGAQHRLYPESKFDPMVFGGFEVSARLSDARSVTIVREGAEAGWAWQLSTALRMLLAFVCVLPVVWLFARALARPIRAFASAADRVGREPGVATVAVSGPAEIRLAAQAVNDMQDRIYRYHMERTGVVGAIAHDLRTPLARLRFHLADVPEPARGRAEDEIDEMQAMISATLDFVEHETKPRRSELIDLSLLVEGLIDDLSDLGEKASLISAQPVVVRGDPLLLKRLFNNLLSNAVKYGSEALVEVADEQGTAVVSIRDRGKGLSDQELARAFEPFWRAEGSRNRQTGGIGLGLAIVRGAARAHGGDVIIANATDGGLVARVALPLA